MSQTPGRNVNPPRFVAGEPVSARKLNMLSDALGGGVGAGDYDMPTDTGLRYPARITGNTSGTNFTWIEISETGAGTWGDRQGGRTSTTVAVATEIFGATYVQTGTRVWIHEVIDTTGARRAWFICPVPGLMSGVFGVKVEKTGGSDGTVSTASAWQYTVRTTQWNGTSGGTTLGTGVLWSAPHPNGSMIFQTGSQGGGMAYYDQADGSFELRDAGEKPATYDCANP